MPEIRKRILNLLPALRETRRALHAMPEQAHGERETQAYLLERLAALAPDSLEPLAGTGVKAVFRAEGSACATAFRADMDALPVSEATGLPFASRNAGVMHACGHDAHMAASLALASLVAAHRAELKETVVFLFQPAEEGGYGARSMIEAGALKNPAINRIYGYHVFPGMPFGALGVREGPLMARACGFDITLKGKSAHGASPQLGRDALVAAAQLVSMLQTLVSRRIGPMENAVLTIGKIAGGTRRNIICEEVTLECTLRTFTDGAHKTMMDGVNAMRAAVEQAFEVTTQLSMAEDYFAVVNDAALAREYRAMAGERAVECERQCISEDFSFYQREVPGLFVFVGVGENVSALHTPAMFFDEEALLPAIDMNARLLGL